jgi:hypothetical protein
MTRRDRKIKLELTVSEAVALTRTRHFSASSPAASCELIVQDLTHTGKAAQA